MSLLIKNALCLYTFDPDRREFEEGYVHVVGKRIADVGGGECERLEADEVIDASG